MDTTERALRLLETEQAFLATGLAALVVAVALLVVVIRACQRGFRPVPALLVASAGFLVGVGIVNLTYDAWYRHRCVHHGSDIAECYEGHLRRQ